MLPSRIMITTLPQNPRPLGKPGYGTRYPPPTRLADDLSSRAALNTPQPIARLHPCFVTTDSCLGGSLSVPFEGLLFPDRDGKEYGARYPRSRTDSNSSNSATGAAPDPVIPSCLYGNECKRSPRHGLDGYPCGCRWWRDGRVHRPFYHGVAVRPGKGWLFAKRHYGEASCGEESTCHSSRSCKRPWQ